MFLFYGATFLERLRMKMLGVLLGWGTHHTPPFLLLIAIL
jgi:hypothetical protein